LLSKGRNFLSKFQITEVAVGNHFAGSGIRSLFGNSPTNRDVTFCGDFRSFCITTILAGTDFFTGFRASGVLGQDPTLGSHICREKEVVVNRDCTGFGVVTRGADACFDAGRGAGRRLCALPVNNHVTDFGAILMDVDGDYFFHTMAETPVVGCNSDISSTGFTYLNKAGAGDVCDTGIIRSVGQVSGSTVFRCNVQSELFDTNAYIVGIGTGEYLSYRRAFVCTAINNDRGTNTYLVINNQEVIRRNVNTTVGSIKEIFFVVKLASPVGIMQTVSA
jgi:hypothetical protein